MAQWYFTCIDNSGKRQCLTITSSNKPDAIKTGLLKAKKNSKGNITDWNCSLKKV